jgi:ribonuclease HI
MVEYKKRYNWNKWKEAIEAKLKLLKKRNVFTDVIPTHPKIFSIEFKWVFIHKKNKNNEMVRYKARLVAQGFMQRLGIDFIETYSPIMNEITL